MGNYSNNNYDTNLYVKLKKFTYSTCSIINISINTHEIH